jgi:Protein of unknown function (DUF3703)
MKKISKKNISERYIKQAVVAKASGQVNECWHCLEYAHIAAQPMALQHLKVHLLMLALSIETLNLKEFFGQLTRSAIAVPGSLLKKYPAGNPGTSHISMFQICEIPSDLREELDSIC